MNSVAVEQFKDTIIDLSVEDLYNTYVELNKQLKPLVSDLAKYESDETNEKALKALTIRRSQEIVFDMIIGKALKC